MSVRKTLLFQSQTAIIEANTIKFLNLEKGQVKIMFWEGLSYHRLAHYRACNPKCWFNQHLFANLLLSVICNPKGGSNNSVVINLYTLACNPTVKEIQTVHCDNLAHPVCNPNGGGVELSITFLGAHRRSSSCRWNRPTHPQREYHWHSDVAIFKKCRNFFMS